MREHLSEPPACCCFVDVCGQVGTETHTRRLVCARQRVHVRRMCAKTVPTGRVYVREQVATATPSGVQGVSMCARACVCAPPVRDAVRAGAVYVRDRGGRRWQRPVVHGARIAHASAVGKPFASLFRRPRACSRRAVYCGARRVAIRTYMRTYSRHIHPKTSAHTRRTYTRTYSAHINCAHTRAPL